MALDRMDLMVSANKLSRLMSQPRESDFVAVKRVVRYLRSHPVCALQYRWQSPGQGLLSLTDSDWATDVKTRRSTSGGAILKGTHVLSFWTALQSNVALSSGEAELTSLVRGVCEALCVHNLLKELLNVKVPMPNWYMRSTSPLFGKSHQ